MKTILISGIIVECIVLALLTILKKWTGKAFLAITVITAVCCGLAGYMAGANKGPDSQENQRADLYMAARLIQEKTYGYMVCVKNGEIDKVPLQEVAGKLKTVDPNCSMIKEAKMVGICFGDE